MREEKSGKESKQVNFRIDPDSAEAFRQFCVTHGMNQAQGFDHLMQVLELNNAKAATPGRAVEIENFERLLKEILSTYIGSIELSSNAEARVLEQVQSDLKRKDRTIDELREKIERMEREKEESTAALSASQEEQARFQEQAAHAADQLNAAKKAASDQEEMNHILRAQNQELLEKLAQYDALHKSEASAKAENAELKLRMRELEQSISHANAQQKKLEANASQAAETIKELEEQITSYRIQISDLQRQVKAKDADAENCLRQAQMQAELALERAVIAKERELQDEIRKADRENVKLQTELEQLKAAKTTVSASAAGSIRKE